MLHGFEWERKSISNVCKFGKWLFKLYNPGDFHFYTFLVKVHNMKA